MSISSLTSPLFFAVTGLLVGCAVEDQPQISASQLGLSSENGLSVNGLSVNGLSVNGLSVNGLSVNGLSVNGLATDTFTSWFNQNSAVTPALMSYIVKCALPSGQSLSWTDPTTGVAYSWPGNLGLAPVWAGGGPPPLVEQQLISACLAAHANKYGLHIQLAVEGLDSQGAQIPMAANELTTYAVPEGCFFGNLFTGDGLFAGSAQNSYQPAKSSPRACALETLPALGTAPCAPVGNIGLCQTYCKKDSTGTYYTSCTFGGKTYQPLTTRILPSDFYTCGDGVCQFTESCGIGKTATNCKEDCGFCQASAP